MKVRKLVTMAAALSISASLLLVWINVINAEDRSLESLYASVGIERISPPIEAADFTLKNLEGLEVSLKDFQGKLVFLNFWATWCGPCRYEMPSMEKLWQNFKENEFVILAVDLREGKEEVESFMKENGLTFPVLLDSRGQVGSIYGVRAIPTTYFIDSGGIIVGRAIGARDWASGDAFDLIEHLLTKTESV